MKKLILAFVSVVISLSAMAQVTTSGLSGKVTSDSGEALIGATVIATHTPSGTEYGAATNIDGRYTIQGMRTGGPYTVTLTYIGHQGVEFTDIYLKLGESFSRNAYLKESQAIDEVVVVSTAADRFNSSKTGAGSSFGSDAIAATPTTDRSVFDIVKTTPQASYSSDGGIVFAGASNRYNSFQVDGAMNNDAFGLTSTGTNGGSVSGNPLSLDAIEAIQVVVAPFDVRQSGFTGGAINAITKSGTNEFKGSVYTYYNNQDFYGTTPGEISEGATREKLSSQLTSTTGFTAGGALKEDKLFLFVSGEYYTESSPTSLYAGLDDFISVEDAQRIATAYKNITGLDDNIDQFDVETESIDVMARLDWNINQNHKFMLRYQLKDASCIDGIASKQYATFANSGYVREHSTNALVAELNSRFSNDISNELRVSYSRVRDFRTPDADVPTFNIYNVEGITTQVCLGMEYSSGVNQLDQDIITLTDNVSIFKGNHTISIGTHNEFYDMTNGFISNANGCYKYQSIEDFENNNPSRYEINYSDVDLTGTSSWMAQFQSAQFGLYIQDEWKPTTDFTLTYGLRADLPVMFTTPSVNDEFNNSAVSQDGTYYVGRAFKSQILWSPRVGFRQNLSDGSLLRGGVGIFTGRVPFVWLSNIYGNTGMEIKSYYTETDIPEVSLTDPYIPESGTASNTVNTISEDFKLPQVLRANLAWEKSLANGWNFTLEALYSKTLNNVLFINVAYEDTGCTFNPVSSSSDVSAIRYTQVDSNYTTAVNLENTNKGYTYDLSAVVSKHFNFGLDLTASYSFGHSYSVNDASSSIASSNWGNNISVNSNTTDELSFSRYDVPHRINVNATYTTPQYGIEERFSTVVSLNYQAYSGSRYSMGYSEYYKNINGDNQNNNTLIYIPTDSEIDQMTFVDNSTYSAEESRELFKEWCNTDDYAKDNRGEWSERYGAQNPFEHHLNLHFSEYYVYNKAKNSKIQLSLDVINFGNMINRNWGLYYSQPYPCVGILTVEETYVDDNNNATAGYSFKGEENYVIDLASRWRMQVGLRVTF